jgi:hypothetical protein
VWEEVNLIRSNAHEELCHEHMRELVEADHRETGAEYVQESHVFVSVVDGLCRTLSS